jgi:hypothetical protein
MKPRVGQSLAALGLVFMAGGILCAGQFHSVIITTSPLSINVGDQQFLRIWNFTQEGGTERGVVTVTTSDGTTNVLTASMINSTGSPSPSSLEPINRVVIAGPAKLTINPVSGATLFVTYRKELDEEGGTASSTPTPTATPTATPTPTPTVTPTPTP